MDVSILVVFCIIFCILSIDVFTWLEVTISSIVDVRLIAFTTRETMTIATDIQQKTVEGFYGFGRVVGVIL